MLSTRPARAALAQAVASAGDPSQLLPAREQMAFTLGFHIIIVPFGVALTSLMLIANYRGLKHGDGQAMLLALRWSKVAAVLFAVGAVTGTVLSFELGLLWPGLMGKYGAAFGFPFAIEGLFFFLEAIFVSIYIYGWKRLPPWVHFWTGVPVAISGLGGTASVVAANSWMNQPGGFTLRDGRVVGVNPGKVFFNGAFWYEATHMFIAAYIVAGFTVCGVYAVGLLKGRRNHYHRVGFLIGFLVAAVAVPVQFFVGDIVARQVFNDTPRKFAAIEMVPKTSTHVPETILGVLHDGRPRYGVTLPDVASLLAGFDPSTRIQGLNEIPPAVRPDDATVSVVHLAFDVMVGIASALLLFVLWFAWLWWRRREVPTNRWFLRCAAVSGFASVVSLECGWVVTEVGRQPWTVVRVLLTRDAVTTVGNIWPLFAVVLAIYFAVAVAAMLVLRTLTRQWHTEGDDVAQVPYGPEQPLVDAGHTDGDRS
ncbi:cytochrome bd-I ubiquinol oxidase subunit 1 apoprotein [Streptomyces sp. DvalAA-14]|uniref:cytochrome ubiquinol oxidase subunit I n=1 Tax=unclassified Streptomyces TaxID=2593676 RepID=UPI00081BB0E1|nr:MULTISPECIES: cytochrome ubiquinol oxidase subunit I [unclassified Streptomyces]MYS22280.1 cytochrome ubiquinol oxidase subunit I [Streptomyces sp. SID4948]SCE12770.1 cytochrome bd-I ubiquinol oxidase subunit 1 apoprotein [Streptomyces sp. DvalAA-14]